MVLTTFSTKAEAIAQYEKIAATIPAGSLFTQDLPLRDFFLVYSSQMRNIRVGALAPNEGVLPTNLHQWAIQQNKLGDCTMIAQMAALLASKNPYNFADMIYPTTISPIGLYYVRVMVPNTKDFVWVEIDDRIMCGGNYTYTEPAWQGGKSYWIAPSWWGVSPLAGGGIWCSLYEKACATIAGSYKALEGWVGDVYPMQHVPNNTFDDVLNTISAGGFGMTTFDRKKDAKGYTLYYDGIAYDHQYGIVNSARITDAAGVVHEIIEIDNPVASRALDFPNPYGDNEQFWLDNPEFQHLVLDSRSSGGSWWMAYQALLDWNSGRKPALRLPIG